MDKKIILSLLIVALIGIVAATYQINNGVETLNPLSNVKIEDSPVTETLAAPQQTDDAAQNNEELQNNQEQQEETTPTEATQTEQENPEQTQEEQTTPTVTTTANTNPMTASEDDKNTEGQSDSDKSGDKPTEKIVVDNPDTNSEDKQKSNSILDNIFSPSNNNNNQNNEPSYDNNFDGQDTTALDDSGELLNSLLDTSNAQPDTVLAELEPVVQSNWNAAEPVHLSYTQTYTDTNNGEQYYHYDIVRDSDSAIVGQASYNLRTGKYTMVDNSGNVDTNTTTN